jgi:hypothetical protein
MCFSAEVDVVAGLAVGAVGIDALRHAPRGAQKPLAAIPVILAVHQLIEAFVWWGLEGRISAVVTDVAVWSYLAVALVLLPVLVPIAVGALEPVDGRRRMLVFTAVGAGVATVLANSLVRGPVEATIAARHIAYDIRPPHGGVLVALYVVATCGAMLWSTHRRIRLYGAANLVVVALLAWLHNSAVISLWCSWAAVTSVAIALHLRHEAPTTVSRARAGADPAAGTAATGR